MEIGVTREKGNDYAFCIIIKLVILAQSMYRLNYMML